MGEKFSIEALDYEQKKQKALLEVANENRGRKMEEAEVQEFLDGADEYKKGLENALNEKQRELDKTDDKKERAKLVSEIGEILLQITEMQELEEVSKDAEEFTVRDIGL